MPSLNALVTQPGSQEPPDIQGSSGADQASSLQGLMGQKPQGAPAGGMQAPSHQETVALLQHLSAFRRRWQQIADDPEIGTKNVRPQIYEMMADMMGEGYASLPEAMGLLKTIPQAPLEQKQFIEKHIQNDDQAMNAVLQHHAQTEGPLGDFATENAKLEADGGDRASLVNGAVARYKKYPKRPSKVGRIPLA